MGNSRLRGIALPLLVLGLSDVLYGVTIASVEAVTLGGVCRRQDDLAASCVSIFDGGTRGFGLVESRAVIDGFNLETSVNIIGSLRLSQSVGGYGEAIASYAGMLTITGGAGSLTSHFSFTLHRSTIIRVQLGPRVEEHNGWPSMSGSIQLETPFIFGEPFPLAARMWTSLSSTDSAFGGGSLGLFVDEVHTLPDGIPVPFSYSYVESPPEPTPEVSTSLLVATGLGLMLLRLGRPNRKRDTASVKTN